MSSKKLTWRDGKTLIRQAPRAMGSTSLSLSWAVLSYVIQVKVLAAPRPEFVCPSIWMRYVIPQVSRLHNSQLERLLTGLYDFVDVDQYATVIADKQSST
jgi:hypothetical protein